MVASLQKKVRWAFFVEKNHVFFFFCKLLKINSLKKCLKINVIFLLQKFVGLKICFTFALAFGKQRLAQSKLILDIIPYRQAVQRVWRYFIVKYRVRNEKRTVNQRLRYIFPASTNNFYKVYSAFGHYRYKLQRRV